MNSNKLDEIRTWWVAINKLESKGKAVDLISFADAAHEYIPVLLAELDRLNRSPEETTYAKTKGSVLSSPVRNAAVTAADLALSEATRVSTLNAEHPLS